MAESSYDIFNQDDLSDYELSPTLLADLVTNKQQKPNFELDQNEASGREIISPSMISYKFPNKFQPSVAAVKNNLIENADQMKCRSKISTLPKNVTTLHSPKISCSLKDIETVTGHPRRETLTSSTSLKNIESDSSSVQDLQRIFNTKKDELEETLNDAREILKSLSQKLSSDSSPDLAAQYKMQLEMVRDVMENINESQIKEFYTKQLTMNTLLNHCATLSDKINLKYPSLQEENSHTANLSHGLNNLTTESQSSTSSETFQEEDSDTASAPETHLIMSNLMPESEENVSETPGNAIQYSIPITQPLSEILEIDSIEFLKKLVICPHDRREFIPRSEFEKKAPGFWDSDEVPKWLLDEIDQW